MILPKIYIGTGGYSETDLIGTLYPPNAKPKAFLYHYANHYDCVEINSSFHAPIGKQALLGMLSKADEQLKFSLKLHQEFSHTRTANVATAQAFRQAIDPFITTNALAPLLLQFPHSFERTPGNRQYLGELVAWFDGLPLAIEFRSPTWHCPPVFKHFNHSTLIWVNADYPRNIGLPTTPFWANARTAYVRLHGRRSDWWEKDNAKDRHDYRYTDTELFALAQTIFDNRANFNELFVYFQNTTNSHSYNNILTFKEILTTFGFDTKTPNHIQASLF